MKKIWNWLLFKLRLKVDIDRIVKSRKILVSELKGTNKIVFKVPVDDLSQDEIIAYVDKINKAMKNKPLVNPFTGEINYDKPTPKIEQDFYIAEY